MYTVRRGSQNGFQNYLYQRRPTPLVRRLCQISSVAWLRRERWQQICLSKVLVCVSYFCKLFCDRAYNMSGGFEGDSWGILRGFNWFWGIRALGTNFSCGFCAFGRGIRTRPLSHCIILKVVEGNPRAMQHVRRAGSGVV